MYAGASIKNLTSESSEELIASYIDGIRHNLRGSGKLVPLLHYNHIVYRNRSRNATIRIRGDLMASFRNTGLPANALPYILEELDSSNSPYLIAAAAMALRGLKQPYPELTDHLLKAIRNIKYSDDAISFATYKPQWPLEKHTSALAELLGTLQWMGAVAIDSIARLNELKNDLHTRPVIKSLINQTTELIQSASPARKDDCCNLHHPAVPSHREKITEQSLTEILFRDQDGLTKTFNSIFAGKPSAVLFFYTRCDNPNRCSLNITRLAQLQQELRLHQPDHQVNLLAISYDPAYDLPMRTKPYCTNRGLQFDSSAMALTADAGMDLLLTYLQPGVNYNGTMLNHHTSEIFLLDEDGKPFSRIPGIEWTNEKVLSELKRMGTAKKMQGLSVKRVATCITNVLFSFTLIVFPKCPFCAAAYLSMFGISSYDFFRLKAWVFPALVGLLLLNLFALFLMGKKRNWYLPFYLSLAGACLTLSSISSGNNTWLSYTGMSLVILGSLLNGLPLRFQLKIRSLFSALINSFQMQRNLFSSHKPFKL